MSLVEDLLSILLDYRGDYPTTCARLRNYTRSKIHDEKLHVSVSDNTLRVTLSRLKQRGLVENKGGKWRATVDGIFFLKKIKNQRKFKLPDHSFKQRLARPKKMIIIFDIPEIEKRKRNWLRIELVNLGFEMIQKSVWLGPAPLQKTFIKPLNDLKLFPYIKFFKATEADIV